MEVFLKQQVEQVSVTYTQPYSTDNNYKRMQDHWLFASLQLA